MGITTNSVTSQNVIKQVINKVIISKIIYKYITCNVNTYRAFETISMSAISSLFFFKLFGASRSLQVKYFMLPLHLLQSLYSHVTLGRHALFMAATIR